MVTGKWTGVTMAPPDRIPIGGMHENARGAWSAWARPSPDRIVAAAFVPVYSLSLSVAPPSAGQLALP